MKSTFFGLVFGLASIVVASPLNNQLSGLSKRALTPDNTCGLVANGNNNGYTCDPKLAQGGPCCSASGYCGSSAAYCGDGCQAAYGTCGVSSASSSATPSSTSSSTPSGSAPVGTSTDTCGANNGGLVCAAGYCCSQSGYCGKTADYCSAGCQAAYGSCGTSSGSSSTASANTPGPTGSTNTCGPNNGNAVCATGLCCSQSGYCGNTTAYCSTGCQPSYGSCSTSSTPSSTGSANGPGPTGSTDLCGPSNGNAVCAQGLCCSPGGYCGTGGDYCGDPTCQYNYGTCDSDTTPNGTSTINDPRPRLGSITYTDDIYDCVQANVVALTFDDGPLYYTNQLLDILKQYGFHATFFITGNNIHKGAIDVTAPYPDVIRRMYTEGHQIASHTWSHYDLANLTSPQRIQQMVKNERAIANIVGKYPTYMRPPYSSCNEDSGCWADMQALGYHRTYFDLDTQDYLNQSPDLVQNSKDIVRWALGNATYGSDFLSIQHDIGQQSVTNLSSYYFDLIQKKGWRGVTVGECLGDPVENWYRTPGTGQGGPISLTTTPSAKPTTTASIKSTTTASTKTTTTASGKTTVSTTASVKPTTTSSTTKSSTKSSTTASTTPATTKIQTATAPVATAQCDQPPSGTFCGKVRSFNDRYGCTVAYYDCKQQQRDCAGKGTKDACLKWGTECTKLEKYCHHCGNHCSDKGFRASGE